MKTFGGRTARLSAAMHKRAKVAKEIGPKESHARNVLAITKRIHAKEAMRRQLNASIKKLSKELRAERRELRLVLQRDSTVFEADSRLLDIAGKADAIDASTNRREQ